MCERDMCSLILRYYKIHAPDITRIKESDLYRDLEIS